MWLTQYDVEAGWAPREVALVDHATIGKRTDWAWATLDPPLQVVGEERRRVLIGARHQGDTVWSAQGRWPMHVYVCVPNDGVVAGTPLRTEDVTIGAWGLLHESRVRADVDPV